MTPMPGSQVQSVAEGEENKEEEAKVNIFDTDAGEMMCVPRNPRFKEFSCEKPMKNGDYVNYEVKGYDM